MEKPKLLKFLFDLGCVSIEKDAIFTLKSGVKSNVYIDLRKLYGHYDVLYEFARAIADEINCKILWAKSPSTPSEVVPQVIAGVPYGAIPLATLVAGGCQVPHRPMIMIRKERKSHGTQQLIEGGDMFPDGYSTILIDDVITSGSSIEELIQICKEDGNPLFIRAIFVIVNRSGMQSLNGIPIYSLLTLDDIQMYYDALNFWADPMQRLSQIQHPLGKQLLEISNQKKTNLILSLDVGEISEGPETQEYISTILDAVGPYIVCVKIHHDFWCYDLDMICIKIKELSEKHNFLIFEDRKLVDIPNTCKMQIENLNKFLAYHMVNVVPLNFDTNSIQIIANQLQESNRGMILLSDFSTKFFKSLKISEKLQTHCLELARATPETTIGFITQNSANFDDPSFLYFTPGVHLVSTGNDAGQQYRTPYDAIVRDRCDFIIVGRGILQAETQLRMRERAKEYAKQSYEAFWFRKINQAF